MAEVAPAKALSVDLTSQMQLITVGKGKDRLLSLTDRIAVLPKLDGVYAIKTGHVLRTRTMAPFRKEIQDRFKDIPSGVCGELIVGPRFATDSWSRTVSDTSKKDGRCEAVLHMFDYAAPGTFYERFGKLYKFSSDVSVVITELQEVSCKAGILSVDPRLIKPPDALAPGATYEGIVLRPHAAAYLATRSSALRPFFMRLKGEETVEGKIVGFSERLHNANVAKDTHDGKLRRHSFKTGLQPTGLLGSLDVRLLDGRKVVVGTGFEMAQAADIWARREELHGTIVELKRHEHVRGTLSGELSEQGAYVFLRLRPDKVTI